MTTIPLSGALSKEDRDALPSSDFAVPDTRDLPIHDATHVKMAWKMVEKTKGLSNEQVIQAKRTIVKRAIDLDVDITSWNVTAENAYELNASAHLSFSCMALQFPDTSDHPNKLPFKGVLTVLDEASNFPPGGSGGKRVILPKDVAEKALSSLLGMCIDFTPDLDGHDAQSKIGLITEATIVNNEIHIAGFLYAADFPNEVKRIQSEKEQLGFSYEAQAQIHSMNDDPLVIKNCVFTGAAVLYKDKAAYTTTSLSARKEKEMEDKAEISKKDYEALQEKLASLEAKLEAANEKALSAASVLHMVSPHSNALRACASNMAAAGIGLNASSGHVAVLNKMADSMDAQAGVGQIPHVYQDFSLYSSAEKAKEEAAEPSKEVQELKASLDSLSTKIVDMEKAKFTAAASPERKTLPPAILNLIAKAGITPSSEDEKFSVKVINEVFSKANMTTAQKIEAKMKLKEAGCL